MRAALLLVLALQLISGCAQSSPQTYDANSWQTMIPASCQSFFDGCNNCSRTPNAEVAACTRMACVEYQKPHCLDTAAKTIHFQCLGETTFQVDFDESGESVVLKTQKTQRRLTREPSASGTRYSDGQWVFWTKGDSALVRNGDKVLYSGCQETP